MLNEESPCNPVLTTIPQDECYDLFSKDDIWAFQARDDANNTFVNGVNGIEEETSWSGLPDAVDTTKVVITPSLEEVTISEGNDLEDSENSDGAPFAVGENPQMFSAIIRNPTAGQYAALKELEKKKNITFYRFDSQGRIGSRQIGSDHAGIIISSGTMRVKSPFREGTQDQIPMKLRISFYVKPEWFSSFDVVTPEDGFDPLTEIVHS